MMLDELRNEIDKIDSEIINLLQDRMQIVINIAKYKKENGIPVFDKERENEVIKKNLSKLQKDEYSEAMEKILKIIMDTSKDVQKNYIDNI